MEHDVIVIGAGAAGIMAALTAKDYGADVALIECNERIGKKLLTTGNGRCNISNSIIDSFWDNSSDLSCTYHGRNNFFIPSLKNFSVETTKNFFYSLGLPLTTMDGGKMYPLSLQASSVLDLLRFSLEEKNIPLYNNCKVTGIIKKASSFQIQVRADNEDKFFHCKKLILCTGGKSAPNTGSDGSGYLLSESLGHSIVKPLPALVQLKLDYKSLKALSGVKFDGTAEIFVDGKSCRKEEGEILFTDYGISGPPILQLSRIASINIDEKRKVTLTVNFLPQFSKEDLINIFETHKALFPYRSLTDSFIGIINKKLIVPLLKEASISDLHKTMDSLTWEEQNRIISLLQHWEFTVYDTNGFKNAQVTCGGVNTGEVDEQTLQSKICPNLYFAGELLDVDGDCGGFNLQWAWSSGYAAGKKCCT